MMKKPLTDFIEVSREGEISVGKNIDPSFEQIGAAFNEYADQFRNGKDDDSVKFDDNAQYENKVPHPKIGEALKTRKSKKEWCDEHGWKDDVFEALASSGVLVKR